MTWGLILDWLADDGSERTHDYHLAATRAEVEALAAEINAADNEVVANAASRRSLSIADFRSSHPWAFEPHEEADWEPYEGADEQ